MPTVLRLRGYRFQFWSNQGTVPPHVHVGAAGSTVKVWLDTLVLARAVGYDSGQLRRWWTSSGNTASNC